MKLSIALLVALLAAASSLQPLAAVEPDRPGEAELESDEEEENEDEEDDHDADADEEEWEEEEEFELLGEFKIHAFLKEHSPEFADDVEKIFQEADKDHLEELRHQLTEIINEYHTLSEDAGEEAADAFLAVITAESRLDKAINAHHEDVDEGGDGDAAGVRAALRDLLEKENAFEAIELERAKKEIAEMEAEIEERKNNLDAIVDEELQGILEDEDEDDDEDDA